MWPEVAFSVIAAGHRGMHEVRKTTVETQDALPSSERQRFFIVTAGRTGSTLLATIMADAGADFGIAAPKDWDVSRGGDMELAAIRRAADHFRVAFERAPRKPIATVSKWIWSCRMSLGKRLLKEALTQARFFKTVNLDLVIPYVMKMGFFPRMIVSCRAFPGYAVSFSQTFGHRSLTVLADDYNRTYRNALLQLSTYGGCVVSYSDLTDPSRTEWANALAETTGLSAEALLASRGRRIKVRTDAERALPRLSDSASEIFAAAEHFAGRALPPSVPALRNWSRLLANQLGAPPTEDQSRSIGNRATMVQTGPAAE